MRVASRSEDSKSDATENSQSPNHKRRHKAPEAAISHAPPKTTEEDGDAKVSLSSKARSSSTPPPAATAHDLKSAIKADEAQAATQAAEVHHDKGNKEITQAELLMEHVHSGKLSAREQELAMNRVGEIVKKYGRS